MVGSLSLMNALPFLAGGTLASISDAFNNLPSYLNYPTIPDDLTTPFQQRLAVYGPNSVSIGWNTYQPIEQPCVFFGTSHGKLDRRACSTTPSTTYQTSRTWSQAVVLPSLNSSTTYYYQIDSTNSSVEHFLSPRIPGDKTPFAIDVVIALGVYGENGFTKGHVSNLVDKKDTIREIQPELNHSTIGRLAQTVDEYEIVIHPGDFAYADDWWVDSRFLPGANIDNHIENNFYAATEVYQSILERFYDQLAPIAGRKPYMASPGNHEASCFPSNTTIPFAYAGKKLAIPFKDFCPQGQMNFTDFMHRFDRTMPNAYPSFSKNTTAKALAKKARSAAQPPFWYSFEYGMAHVVMINTETDFKDAPEGPGGSTGLNQGNFGKRNQQLEFLKADLASVDRSVTPWVIVASHRPYYSCGGSAHMCRECQKAFEDIFYTYGVDLGIFGHVHNSQRFPPMYQGKVDPNNLTDPTAPMYIIAGGAGNIEGLTPVGSVPPENEFNYADDWSYATVKLLDEQHLQVDFIKSTTGEILDSSTLFKSHKEQFVR
ncbi:hypothetical protein N7509_005490 [Penicillium cosmopolitanum]|uniref:Purple acid phosphatase n=1 Tax=Penicillium cosmopolitanum TaxID=1131564 RepID=A0A9W9W2J4_9EURO|nr:uncharacterized protein N7509_005490 [Penicillium cosmopolitanum]KAJ5397377.1 hypothetical protein N7509_005490 [Penicillium cosmopolitanum]